MTDKVTRWAIKWREDNKLEGKQEYFVWDYETPELFMTRREARAFIEKDYGYIRARPYLREEPHGWKMPQAVKVEVTLKEIT